MDRRNATCMGSFPPYFDKKESTGSKLAPSINIWLMLALLFNLEVSFAACRKNCCALNLWLFKNLVRSFDIAVPSLICNWVKGTRVGYIKKRYWFDIGTNDTETKGKTYPLDLEAFLDRIVNPWGHVHPSLDFSLTHPHKKLPFAGHPKAEHSCRRTTCWASQSLDDLGFGVHMCSLARTQGGGAQGLVARNFIRVSSS